MEAAFRRYRVMSFVTGTTLLSLFVFLGIHTWDLAFWQQHLHGVVVVDGMLHGVVLYPIYLIMSFHLTVKARLPIGYLALMLLGGFVPFAAFIMEYYTRRRLFPDGLPAA